MPFWPSSPLRSQLVASVVSTSALLLAVCATAEDASPPFIPQLRPVTCAGVPCGSMEISWYREFHDGDAAPDFERNGVNIRGRFRTFRDQPREFHYLQALTRFEAADFRWIRDPAAVLPPRFVDVPPFGVRRPEIDTHGQFRIVEHKFDALPWFDEGEFPLFDDRPRAFLASARAHGRVTMEFETWLVCVIEAKEGTDRERVSDDSYRVAALLGWTWGYDITYRDVGAIGVDELEDYVFTLVPLRFVTEPSAAFEAALGATIGQTVTDRFDIQLGDAKECSNRPR